MPVALHEWVIAPLAFSLTLLHARRALGITRASFELMALALLGFVADLILGRLLGTRAYSAAWSVAPLGIPLAPALAWAASVLSALALGARSSWSSAAGRAANTILVATSLRLLIEPVAVRIGAWRWSPAGSWLEVPMGAYVGGAALIGAYVVGIERAQGGGGWALAGARARIGVSAWLGLVLVGLAWNGLRLETLIAGWPAWLAGAGVLAATLSLALRERAAVLPSTLAGELAAAPATLPCGVYLLLGAAATWDALALGEPALAGLSVAGFVALAPGLWKLQSARGERIDVWRRRALARFAAVQGLVQVLMKPRNGMPWTEADRAFLKHELRRLAQWTPALILFLLPGGFVLLAAYAWLLDRRRSRRTEA